MPKERVLLSISAPTISGVTINPAIGATVMYLSRSCLTADSGWQESRLGTAVLKKVHYVIK